MAVFSGPNSVEDGLVMLVDSSNKKSFSPNVFPKGTDIYGWYVDTKGNNTANNCNLTRDTISSPVGNTPLKMSVTANDPHLASYNSSPWNLANAASGESWTISVYVKASQSTTGELLVFGAGSNSQYLEVPNTTVNITTSWTRVSYTATFSNASTVFLQMRLDGTNSGGAGIDIWWDGLQIERGSTATEFTKEYTLDSSLNERMLDLSGKTNNGTMENVFSYNSLSGGSLVFNGANDFIEVSYDASLKPSSEIAMESFCYIQDNGGTWASLIQYPQNSSSHTSPFFDWAIYLNQNDRKFHTRIDGVGGDSPTGVWNFNEWTHLVITFANQQANFYVNGVLVGSATISKTSILYSNNNPVYIGKNASGGEPFEGRLANIKVYNRALSAAEVQRNFNALRGRFGI